ncbi:MAG TPA: phospholipase D family protein [Steroidobacteraceae bacterium]|nr:phospholipase D family protein [Steroidobacteraceae bacterium]
MTRWLRALALVAVLPWLAHCASAPRMGGIVATYAVAPATDTALDRAVLAELGAEPTASSVRLVEDNAVAFAVRAATAAAAERTLDVQYYIWHEDLTGRLLSAELLRAAERGVRVRILIDDLDARDKHENLAVADLHPNVEVRLFNPFYSRSGLLGWASEWLLRASRLNHRMHNKSWIADNRIAIIGGRNIGDEYFGASPHSNFADLDVALAGPIVADVSGQFDDYWNSTNAVPVSRFDFRKPKPRELEAMLERAIRYHEDVADTPYVRALRDVQQRTKLLAKAPAALRVEHVRLLVDDPGKVGADQGVDGSRVLAGLNEATAQSQREVLIVSPYFVPGEKGAARLVRDVERGLRVAVLTNSLAATDVAAVHTGYARVRRQLARGGVELYEMKRKAGSADGRSQISVTGSSGASLHSKAMLIDRRWVYVGSMNLDPRSAILNTEMGVLVDSPELAEQLRDQWDLITSPELSYRVVLEPDGELVWYDRARGKQRRSQHEPDASVMRRVGVTLLRMVPIDSQL